MVALNRRAAELMEQFEVHACTDVTGFGLLGHLKSMAAASKVDVELAWEDIPLLPGVVDCVAAGIVPGGVERNRESSAGAVAAIDGVDPACLDILCDAQTSGGLLISLPGGAAEALVARLRAEGMEEAAVVGRVAAEGTGRITVSSRSAVMKKHHAAPMSALVGVMSTKEKDAMPCCEHDQDPVGPSCRDGLNDPAALSGAESVTDSSPSRQEGPTAAGETREKFQAFLEAANGPGLRRPGRSGRWPLPWPCWPVAALA